MAEQTKPIRSSTSAHFTGPLLTPAGCAPTFEFASKGTRKEGSQWTGRIREINLALQWL